MTIEEFKSSLAHPNPPGGLRPELQALWYDAKGDWEKSHSIIQELETKNAALIHAYLHRKEGDEWNADYWYRKSGGRKPGKKLEDEWEGLVKSMLELMRN